MSPEAIGDLAEIVTYLFVGLFFLGLFVFIVFEFFRR